MNCRKTTKPAPLPEIPADVLSRLRDFRQQHGPQWRSKLRLVWLAGRDGNDHLLRQARNLIGPSGLDRINLDG